jgi:adenosylhomocysteine nucleosidase
VLLTNAGLGKVNASIAATLLYDRFDCELIVFPGLAGGLAPEVEVGTWSLAHNATTGIGLTASSM